MGKSTRFAIERNQKLPHRRTIPDAQSKGLAEPTPKKPADALTAPKPAKLGAEKLTPEEQKRRFIEAAQAAGASEDEADFDTALKQIAKAKPPTPNAE